MWHKFEYKNSNGIIFIGQGKTKAIAWNQLSQETGPLPEEKISEVSYTIMNYNP